MRRSPFVLLLLWAGVLLLPSVARAQANLSGLVQDESGAVLPGVTVEASSPALIEKVRSVVTDGAGRYAIVDLRPGTYVVTFSLAGFSTVRREGVALSGSGAVQVNVNLAVGAVEQAITVSGAAPLVDVQTTQQQFIVSKQLFDTIPTPLRDFRSRANLIPGATQFKYGFGQGAGHQMTMHGSVSTDARLLNDGMWVPGLMSGYGEFGGQNFFIEGAQEEVTFDTDGQGAEAPGSGIRMNSIPKVGGNTFSGQVVLLGATQGMGQKRAADEKASIGGNQVGLLGNGDKLKYNYDTDVVFGGPIKKDKLWFFVAHRYLNDVQYVANTFFLTTLDPNYKQGEQAFLKNIEHAEIGRVAYQISPRNKMRVSYVNNRGDSPYNFVGGGRQPEATPEEITLTQDFAVKWQSPVTNRLLLEAGFSRSFYSQTEVPKPYQQGQLSIQELSTAVLTGAYSGGVSYYGGHHRQAIASMSYVTGSHALKAGMSFENAWYLNQANYVQDIAQLRFNLNRPSSVLVANTPRQALTNIDGDLGLYLQDRWTIRRFTLNLGVRYDYFKGSVPSQTAPTGVWVPDRSTNGTDDVPLWKDWEPRLGVAYDLFGNGRTALKFSTGRYVMLAPGQFTQQFNELNAQTENRTWTDLDGNRSVLDASGKVQFNEVGPKVNALFGLPGSANRLDPNFTRPYNWEANASIQHELRAGLSLAAAYHGRWYKDLPIVNNVRLNPVTDYYTYTIVGPVDPRLPNGGGEIITMYDVNPSKAGQVDNLVTNAANNYRNYLGFEVTATWRLPKGGLIYGGVTPERNTFYNCDPPASVASFVQGTVNPNDLRFCSSQTPFQSLVKVAGSYPLPYGIELSGVFQKRPGIRLGALYTVNNAVAGRTLTVIPPAVELIPSDTRFYDNYKQLDLRVGRIFKMAHLTTRAYADIYNIFNGATVYGGPRAGQVTGAIENYGANWLLPNRTQQARNLRVGVQLEF